MVSNLKFKKLHSHLNNGFLVRRNVHCCKYPISPPFLNLYVSLKISGIFLKILVELEILKKKRT